MVLVQTHRRAGHFDGAKKPATPVLILAQLESSKPAGPTKATSCLAAVNGKRWSGGLFSASCGQPLMFSCPPGKEQQEKIWSHQPRLSAVHRVSPMPFEVNAVYIAPNDQKYQAQLDQRQYGEHRSWTLLPVHAKARKRNGELSRDTLEQMLFVDRGRIVRFDFDSPTLVVDTGWTFADLRPASN